MKRLIALIKCKLLGHEYRMHTYYDDNVQKIKCARCKKYFGINHDVRSVIPWDDELEKCMKLMYPERFINKQ